MNNPSSLRLSCDRKTRFYKTQKNTLGLLPGPEGSCPGATTGEGGCWNKEGNRKLETCYVTRCISCYPGVKKILTDNTILLKDADDTTKLSLLNTTVDELQTQNVKYNRPDANYYRLHWSGDIFNESYANAIAESIRQHPNTNFWGYTRSLFAVPRLCRGLSNLSLYISVDKQNIKEGTKCYEQFKDKGIKLAYLAPTVDISIPGVNFVSCPVDSDKMELEGACAKCKLCLRTDKQTHIHFKTT